jgi:hypothetical protein
MDSIEVLGNYENVINPRENLCNIVKGCLSLSSGKLS